MRAVFFAVIILILCLPANAEQERYVLGQFVKEKVIIACSSKKDAKYVIKKASETDISNRLSTFYNDGRKCQAVTGLEHIPKKIINTNGAYAVLKTWVPYYKKFIYAVVESEIFDKSGRKLN